MLEIYKIEVDYMGVKSYTLLPTYQPYSFREDENFFYLTQEGVGDEPDSNTISLAVKFSEDPSEDVMFEASLNSSFNNEVYPFPSFSEHIPYTVTDPNVINFNTDNWDEFQEITFTYDDDGRGADRFRLTLTHVIQPGVPAMIDDDNNIVQPAISAIAGELGRSFTDIISLEHADEVQYIDTDGEFHSESSSDKLITEITQPHANYNIANLGVGTIELDNRIFSRGSSIGDEESLDPIDLETLDGSTHSVPGTRNFYSSNYSSVSGNSISNSRNESVNDSRYIYIDGLDGGNSYSYNLSSNSSNGASLSRGEIILSSYDDYYKSESEHGASGNRYSSSNNTDITDVVMKTQLNDNYSDLHIEGNFVNISSSDSDTSEYEVQYSDDPKPTRVVLTSSPNDSGEMKKFAIGVDYDGNLTTTEIHE